MSEMGLQSNGSSNYMCDTNNVMNNNNNGNFSDEHLYNRLKRKSSLTFSSHCTSNSIPLNLAAVAAAAAAAASTSPLTTANTYQPPNSNPNQQSNAVYRCKVQKTDAPTTMSNGQTVGVPIYNNAMLSQHYPAVKSSASSPGAASSSASSPMSPLITPTAFQNTKTDSDMNSPQNSGDTMPLQRSNSAVYLQLQSFALMPDCGSKYVQEWLYTNRFSSLLHLFSHYGSNDILRLSKDDLIKLCGAPDGIRCYNLAHNIQIKSKLTIFVTFQSSQSYFSAIFLADWKCKFLVKRLFSLFTGFVSGLSGSNSGEKDAKTTKLTLRDEQIVDNSNEHLNVYSEEGDECENGGEENGPESDPEQKSEGLGNARKK